MPVISGQPWKPESKQERLISMIGPPQFLNISAIPAIYEVFHAISTVLLYKSKLNATKSVGGVLAMQLFRTSDWTSVIIAVEMEKDSCVDSKRSPCLLIL
uniref:Uncharacterized protein n=1 Tax=Salix viminalis TaxID=40686 RepID=A0A6N2N8X0_SALVM